jgi:hypothetical protein
MAANPGHYVAAVTVPGDDGGAAAASSRARKRRLKLLRPDDTLALGGVYRLVSFEGTVRILCPCCRFTRRRQSTLACPPAYSLIHIMFNVHGRATTDHSQRC